MSFDVPIFHRYCWHKVWCNGDYKISLVYEVWHVGYSQISLTYVNETCAAKLDSLKVTQLSGIQVDVTGLDGLSWLLSFIAKCASGSYKEKIVNAVEEQLSADIKKLLSQFHCDQYFQRIHN